MGIRILCFAENEWMVDRIISMAVSKYRKSTCMFLYQELLDYYLASISNFESANFKLLDCLLKICFELRTLKFS